MLYEQNEKQKELFDEFKPKDTGLKFFKAQKGLAQNRIFFLQFSIEKMVFLLIAFVLIIILTFCLGVERGKKTIAPPQPERAVVKQQPMPVPAKPVAVKPAAAKPVPLVTNINKPVIRKGELYTIRMATYINKKSAADEASKIRQMGFPAYIKVSDKFYMICVGDYSDKKQADAALAALKKIYKDIYIKTNKK